LKNVDGSGSSTVGNWQMRYNEDTSVALVVPRTVVDSRRIETASGNEHFGRPFIILDPCAPYNSRHEVKSSIRVRVSCTPSS
jgi:hypothetical protein